MAGPGGRDGAAQGLFPDQLHRCIARLELERGPGPGPAAGSDFTSSCCPATTNGDFQLGCPEELEKNSAAARDPLTQSDPPARTSVRPQTPAVTGVLVPEGARPGLGECGALQPGVSGLPGAGGGLKEVAVSNQKKKKKKKKKEEVGRPQPQQPQQSRQPQKPQQSRQPPQPHQLGSPGRPAKQPSHGEPSLETAPPPQCPDPQVQLEEQLQREVDWCVEQLELGLRNQKSTPKQTEDARRALHILRSDKAVLARKRQLMRSLFGDYRAKMEAERRRQLQLMQAATKSARVLAVDTAARRRSGQVCRRRGEPSAWKHQGPGPRCPIEISVSTSPDEFCFNFF
ncbi:UPF0488 protein C8orf33 homolog isoform X1 [Ornithorhynchus anatinus]|uniref:UPF0488 protein C8orf33 homolog isoform X1 n=1 Tax=Ornithorhynchus anatinus TaxID=9258 RepID=UPI0010A8B44F|nr:UPF0488 protein C8orf33 homolog isoform X1 [Ornithorhynchus anatinus]